MGPAVNETAQRACYLAQSANDDGAGVAEPLRAHLQALADCAAAFATGFAVQEQAYAAGLLHDLGKYADQFQRRLANPNEPGRDHWSAGAVALAAMSPALGIVVDLGLMLPRHLRGDLDAYPPFVWK